MSKSLKIITLNTWGGRIAEPLKSFIEKYKDVDIFCFQEVFHDLDEKMSTSDFIIEDDANKNLFSSIKDILDNHQGHFLPHLDNYGLAIFLNKEIGCLDKGEELLYKNDTFDPKNHFNDHDRKLQWIKIRKNDKEMVIINVHGHWTGKGKKDTEERIYQSTKIKEVLDKNQGEEILCGDLNLLPDTESIKIIEDAGLRNLIKENNIESTRTSFYTKPDKHADYIFVSSGVKVLDFKVLPDEVSDHSALYLEIE